MWSRRTNLRLIVSAPRGSSIRAFNVLIPRVNAPMDNPHSNRAADVAEWAAKSVRARALAGSLEEKARSRPAERPYLLELVRKLRAGASIFERRVLAAQVEGGKPSFQAPSASPPATAAKG